jgi:hypothetical protein
MTLGLSGCTVLLLLRRLFTNMSLLAINQEKKTDTPMGVD